MRRPLKDPHFEHVMDLFERDSALDVVLRGHLLLEALVARLAELEVTHDKVWTWGFQKKIDECRKRRLIDDHLHGALSAFNSARNDYAHVFGYTMSEEEAFALARRLDDLGIDFSDDSPSRGLAVMLEWYGDTAGIVLRCVHSLFLEVGVVLHERGVEDPLA